MSGSYDRAGTISFRCVADAEDDCGTDGKLCIQSKEHEERGHEEETKNEEAHTHAHAQKHDGKDTSKSTVLDHISINSGSNRNPNSNAKVDVVAAVVVDGGNGVLRATHNILPPHPGASNDGKIEIWSAAPPTADATRVLQLRLGATVVVGNLTATLTTETVSGAKQEHHHHHHHHQ